MNARGQLLKTMKHSMLLPHELVASFFQRADLWSMLVGGPGETWHVVCLICNPSRAGPIRTAAQALRKYWEGERAIQNDFFCSHAVLEATVGEIYGAPCMPDLTHPRMFWQEVGYDYCIPLRLYGDGADAYRDSDTET